MQHFMMRASVLVAMVMQAQCDANYGVKELEGGLDDRAMGELFAQALALDLDNAVILKNKGTTGATYKAPVAKPSSYSQGYTGKGAKNLYPFQPIPGYEEGQYKAPQAKQTLYSQGYGVTGTGGKIFKPPAAKPSLYAQGYGLNPPVDRYGKKSYVPPKASQGVKVDAPTREPSKRIPKAKATLYSQGYKGKPQYQWKPPRVTSKASWTPPSEQADDAEDLFA
jgi:hypothetical protein